MASPEETRVKNLEAELGLLKNQVQQTLLDIREHVLEFTNPFTAEARLVRAWQERTAQTAESNLGGEADLESLLDMDEEYEDSSPAPEHAPAQYEEDAFDGQTDSIMDDGEDLSLDLGGDAYEEPTYDQAPAQPQQQPQQTQQPQQAADDWGDAFDDDGYDDSPQYDSPPAYAEEAPDARQPYERAYAEPAYAEEDAYSDAFEDEFGAVNRGRYADEADDSAVSNAPVPPEAEDESEEDDAHMAPEPELKVNAATQPAAAPQPQPVAEMISSQTGMDLVKLISLVRWVDQNIDRIGKDRVMVILDIHAMSGRITEDTRDLVKRLCALDRDDATRVPVKDVVAAMLTIDNVLDDQQTQSQRLLGMLFDDPFSGLSQGGAGLLG